MAFRQHYESLSDDELVHLALTRELVPEAAEALRSELNKRGINDLSAHRNLLQQEETADEAHRQHRIAHARKTSRWTSIGLTVLGVGALLYGIYRLALPSRERPGDDGGIMLVLGIAVLAFAWLRHKVSTLWYTRVLFRKPPR